MKKMIPIFIVLSLIVPAFASAKAPKDTTPPAITSLHIQSSNTNPSVAVPGDTVSITLVTSEKVDTPVVLVNARPLLLRPTNQGGNSWVASYQVVAKDPTGKAAWAIGLADTAGNVYACTSPRVIIIPYCPTTDGSSVTVTKQITPPPPGDTTPPVLAPHADVSANTTGTSATVSYTLPSATDDHDGSVAVVCTPAPGSTFAVGSTPVACSAHDAAGNVASSTFNVIVTHTEPEPYQISAQSDDSYACGKAGDDPLNYTRTWRSCEFDQDGSEGPGYTAGTDSSTATISLGQGSSLGGGTLTTVTIAHDGDTLAPWLVSVTCSVDQAGTQACADWGAQPVLASETTDGKHWTAGFSSQNLSFNPAEYYQLVINDTVNGQDRQAPAYGSQNPLVPYYVVMGLR